AVTREQMARIPLKFEQIIDAASLRAELDAIVATGDTASAGARSRVMKLLKMRLAEGWKATEAMLSEDGSGTACATRLSHLMDEIVCALYDFAAAHVYPARNPS